MAGPALSIQQFNRRVAIKAAASFAAMAAATRAGVATPTRAQSAEEPVTSSLTWVEAEQPDTLPDADGLRTFQIEAPFSAIAPIWSGEADADVLIELSVSIDGETWSDPVTVGEASHDAGPPDRDGRRFGELQLA